LSKNGCFYLIITYGNNSIPLYIKNSKKKRFFPVNFVDGKIARRNIPKSLEIKCVFDKNNLPVRREAFRKNYARQILPANFLLICLLCLAALDAFAQEESAPAKLAMEQALEREIKGGEAVSLRNLGKAFRFEEAGDFSEGFAPVKSTNKRVYVKPDETAVADLEKKTRYEKAEPFAGGLALVETGGASKKAYDRYDRKNRLGSRLRD